MATTAGDGSTSSTSESAAAATAAQDAFALSPLGKKYGSVEKAVAGVTELTNYASKTKDELSAANAENNRLKQQVAALAGVGRPDGAPSSKIVAAANELAISPELFTGAMAEFFGLALQPLAQSNQAVAEHAKNDETFAERQQSVFQFRDADPQIKERFHKMEQSDPLGAVEWLDSRFLQENPAPESSASTAERVHGGIGGGKGPKSRIPQGNPQEELEKATKFFNETGQHEPMREKYLDMTSGKREFVRQLQSSLGIGG